MIDVDYPSSEIFQNYFERLDLKGKPSVDYKVLSDEEFFKHPRIVATLRAIGIITGPQRETSCQCYQNSDKVEINELKGVPL
jgi:hypothetical protein